MSKVSVVVTGGNVDGKPSGTKMEISKKSAIHLEKYGLVEIVKEAPVKKESAPKKQASKKSTKSAKKTEDKTKEK